MNLITKLIENLKSKNQFDFENFDTKYKKNLRLAVNKFKKMQRGVNRLLDRTAIDYYVYDPFAEVDKIYSIMMKQTKSEGFSFNFSHIIICAKMFAANFLATDEGQTYKEIKFACERLCEMADCLNFNLMAHINFETKQYVIYKNDSFHVEPNSYASHLVELINFVNNTMMEIAQGIYNRDNKSIYKAFTELCDYRKYLFKSYEGVFDDIDDGLFEL